MKVDYKEVERLAGLFFSPDDICIIMELHEMERKKDKFKKAYKRGMLMVEAAVRKTVIDLAISGSSPAQVATLLLIEKAKSHNSD
jgi:hypothetical protein